MSIPHVNIINNQLNYIKDTLISESDLSTEYNNLVITVPLIYQSLIEKLDRCNETLKENQQNSFNLELKSQTYNYEGRRGSNSSFKDKFDVRRTSFVTPINGSRKNSLNSITSESSINSVSTASGSLLTSLNNLFHFKQELKDDSSLNLKLKEINPNSIKRFATLHKLSTNKFSLKKRSWKSKCCVLTDNNKLLIFDSNDAESELCQIIPLTSNCKVFVTNSFNDNFVLQLTCSNTQIYFFKFNSAPNMSVWLNCLKTCILNLRSESKFDERKFNTIS